jgi:CheY-like chemotaxis protein
MTWLIVEDEQDIHDILLSMFELWGVNGESFVDGAAALRWIDKVDMGRVKTNVKLALLDIRLPDVSGIDVSARIRQSPYLGQIPIILTTAYRLSLKQERQTLLLSGANTLIYKPLPDLTELRKILNGIIEDVEKNSSFL